MNGNATSHNGRSNPSMQAAGHGAATGLVKALAEAKAAGIDPGPVLKLVDWE